MSTKRAIEISKQVILLAGVKGKLSDKERSNIQNGLEKYKSELQKSRSDYAKKVLEFIDDLLEDIHHGRALNLDTLEHDEYVENYFLIENQVDHYNLLIDEMLYKTIIGLLRTKNPDVKKLNQCMKKLESHFQQHYKKLAAKTIARHLLIFSLFEIKKPQIALKNIFMLAQHHGLEEMQEQIRRLYSKISVLKSEVKQTGIHYYQTKKFTQKFMKFSRDSRQMSSEVGDASTEEFRSGNALREYEKCLRRL